MYPYIKVPAVVGVCEVVREAYPDHTALDPNHAGFDPKSTAEAPKWFMVDVQFIRDMRRPVTLKELRAEAGLS